MLFGFDYFYQLEDEVTFIWSRRDWSVGKALFIPTRYIPLIIISLTIFANVDVVPQLSANVSPHSNINLKFHLLDDSGHTLPIRTLPNPAWTRHHSNTPHDSQRC
ncbi:hypothetical protein BDN67DRAFT_976241 [Paxillus ammoniavirescens]|nr:hypothetical protein BDN67DRAFT_976241 [Paxillus ammoniavirescens]